MTQSPTKIKATFDAACRLYPDKFAALVSGGAFKPFRYQRFIARKIAKAISRGNGRLIVNLPSRHGKSELCSHWLPVWFIDSRPDRRVAVVSYGAELAEDWGRTVRNEFETNPNLMVRLREDSSAANRWNTPQGGGMIALGIGGPFMGRGADLIVIDDPHKDWDEAHSPLVRSRVIDWFGSTLYSRREPGATIVVLQQRLHEEDLSGFLIEKHSDPWEVIRLPALAEENDPMGREPGEALCPERYDEHALALTRAGMIAPAWDAMFQQHTSSYGTGRVYHAFVPALHEDKSLRLRDDLPLDASFDFNVNPGMHVVLGQYDPRADFFTAVHEIHGPRMKLAPALDALERFVRERGGLRWGKIRIFGDATGSAERAETTDSAYDLIHRRLRATGWRYELNVPASNPPIRQRVETFNDALRDSAGDVHYKLNPLACPRLLADLKWLKEGDDGLPDKRDTALSHSGDAEGYRVVRLRPIRKVRPAVGQVVLMR